MNPGSVTVVVVGISGDRQIARCLDALNGQLGAPPFDVVVACDPELVDSLRERYPSITIVTSREQCTPPELSALALRESHGELILLTEDHCTPDAHWVSTLHGEQSPDRAAVGGAVEADTRISAVDWAVYFVDFYRYMPPLSEGEARSLTHCNIAYRRSNLEEISAVWDNAFDETTVNAVLRERFGKLWLAPRAIVSMHRHVQFLDAIRERYVFGRLFGCLRIESMSIARRIAYALVTPVVPLLVMTRMARTAMKRSATARAFARALPPLAAMVIAWSWGEWLGYLTARSRPLFIAPEIR